MQLILFDIDGTLLWSDGAGMRALRKAVAANLPGFVDHGNVRPDGKTDPEIVSELLSDNDLSRSSPALVQAVLDDYIPCLQAEIESADLVVLPGVAALTDALSNRPNVLLGLSTGNIESGARLKLEAVGLNKFFSFGGFGSDGIGRTQLIQAAIQRGLALSGCSEVDSVTVIGDTPRDIHHGREAGTQTVGVATGNYSVQELRDTGADLVLKDLTERSRLLRFLDLGEE